MNDQGFLQHWKAEQLIAICINLMVEEAEAKIKNYKYICC